MSNVQRQSNRNDYWSLEYTLDVLMAGTEHKPNLVL